MAHLGDPEVLVVGAGPVGLLTAIFLNEHGVDVAVVDQDRRTALHSYALALHPGSVGVLDELRLAANLLGDGRRIRKIAFYEGAERKAEIDLGALASPRPFLLVVRQSLLERALEEELRRRRVRIFWNHRLQGLAESGERADAEIAQLDQVAMGYPIARSEWVVVKTLRARPAIVVGADGYDSGVRRHAGIGMRGLGGSEIFSLFEFEAEGSLPDEGRVVLDPAATNVYWPLEANRCRLSFQIPDASAHDPGAERLSALKHERLPWLEAVPKATFWSSLALFERRLAERFGRGPFWLAGDAAHLTGPVGIQSMNIGLLEARDLAAAIAGVLRKGAPRSTLDAWGEHARESWERLLTASPRARPSASPWVRDRAARILSSLPASGGDLGSLLAQLELEI